MAVCLHYFYLVVFFLMLGEGIEVLVTIVKVFSSRSKLREIVIMGWGIPLIIVAISTGVTELEGYGNSKFCWLSIDGGLIWAFLGPALFVIFVNHLLMSILYLTGKSSVNEYSIFNRAALRSICVLLPVMGVSWVFGILSINEDLVIFDYIFSIFNSLQGLFIFIFHCVINRKVREGLANRRRRYRSRHTSLSAQKSGSRSVFDVSEDFN
ncbi:hypothetical protein LOTGIDRAFT_142706 [Lottia gigantea]|uniref:G-protein coupled receptors family 2 profile 2 domain-containing protein n=1 Tax=Lottia gigantea TaxID=225164 RepID=V4AN36_LOTGI|nr:hypothetical protein LOTGIDRAFT_142706 [Lottia gigantea]ESO98567.1 hypothetical protein LOTGIDRAFT_142706 [Lottia gigantea]